jgi:hypothetical protein
MNPLELARRRLDGLGGIDDWGFDHELRDAVLPLVALRWAVECIDPPAPPDGPALVVANRWLGLASEPSVVALAVRSAWGRTARVAGAPDITLLAPTLRRMGMVLGRADEVRGVLRDGHIGGLLASSSAWRPERVGPVPRDLLAPAVELGVPVIPLALRGRPWGRRWIASFGEPFRPHGHGPLVVAELADAVREVLQERLDELS